MKKIKIHLGKRSYPIVIGSGIMPDIARVVPVNVLGQPVLIVSNRKIFGILGKPFTRALSRVSKVVDIAYVPDSERAKTFEVYTRLILRLSEIGKKGKPTVLALGGGVVGDLAGFAAATYRRGVSFIQVPTTLLAQVDSSIGGKVAIDLPRAKNLVGCFYQPCLVLSDIDCLSTLPPKEIRNGLAEVIKYGVIGDVALFDFVEDNMKAVIALEKNVISHVVNRCAAIKAYVVEKDEYDKFGKRAVLNLGHTFAHAIESSAGYSERYTHGESVAVGMVLAFRLAFRLDMIRERTVRRVLSVIKRAGLPTAAKGVNPENILTAIAYDKKFISGANKFVIPDKIGHVKVVEDIPQDIIREILKKGVSRG